MTEWDEQEALRKRWVALLSNPTLFDEWWNSPEELEYRSKLPRVGYIADALARLHVRLHYPADIPWRGYVDAIEAYEAIRNRIDYAENGPAILGYDPNECDDLDGFYYEPEGWERAQGDAIDEWLEAYRDWGDVPLQMYYNLECRQARWLKQRFNDDIDAAEAWAEAESEAKADAELDDDLPF